MKPPITLTAKRAVLAAVFLLGVLARFIHFRSIDSNLPFHLGGLFLTYAEEILNHGYGLPQRIPVYTAEGIPFVYPPLAFYIEAIIIDLFNPPVFLLVNVLPPLLSCIALAAFWLVCRQLPVSYVGKIAALVTYAFLPSLLGEMLGAAGLAEATGSLFLILLVWSLNRLTQRNSALNADLVGVFLALSILSAPGAAMIAPILLLLYLPVIIWEHRHEPPRLVGHLVLAAVIAVTILSPYLYRLFFQHGIDQLVGTFTNASSEEPGSLWERFLRFEFLDTTYPTFWSAMLVIGIIWSVAKRQYILLIWFLAAVFLPRERYWLSPIPVALLVGGGVGDIIVPSANRIFEQHYANRDVRWVVWAGLLLAATYFIFVPARQRIERMLNEDFQILSQREYAVLADLNTVLPIDAHLVVHSDTALMEWSPYVTARTVLNVRQGSEWEPEERTAILLLENRINRCDSYDCLLTVLTAHPYMTERVYFLMDFDRHNNLAGISADSCAGVPIIYAENNFIVCQIDIPQP